MGGEGEKRSDDFGSGTVFICQNSILANLVSQISHVLLITDSFVFN